MFQKIILGTVVFCALSIVSFFLIIKVIDFNEYKPKIQKAIKESTGYELAILGDIVLSLSPVGVSISDVEVSNPHYKSETPFVKLGNFDVAVEIAPLFHKEVKVKHIALDNFTLLIEKAKEGMYNFEMPAINKKEENKKSETKDAALEPEEALPLVNVTQVKFSNAKIEYNDEATGKVLNVEKINLNLNDINYDSSKKKLQAIMLKADANIGKIDYDTLKIKDIEMAFDLKDAIANLEYLKYTIFDTVMSGSAKVDISGKTPKVSLKHKITDLKLESVSQFYFGSDLLNGTSNGDLKLAFSLGDMRTIKSTLNGVIQLYAEDVNVKGYNIDSIVSTLNSATVTPISLNFSSLLTSNAWNTFKGTGSVIKQLNTKVDIEYSEIQLSDVALSTAKNRLAFKGALQIVEEKFLDVKAALLDKKGCSTFEQTIIGTFSKPSIQIDETNVKALSSMALSVLKKNKTEEPKQTKQDDNCTPFYEGVVK